MAEVTKRLVLLCTGAKEGRGAWFTTKHRDSLIKASQERNFVLLEVDQATLDQVDPNLPAGNMAADGSPEPLPVMLRVTFDRLLQLAEARQLAKPIAPASAAAKPALPAPWSELRVGSIVLASDAKDDGWWEAVVLAVEEAGHTLRLRWRDFEDFEPFTRPVGRVGLLSPTGLR